MVCKMAVCALGGNELRAFNAAFYSNPWRHKYSLTQKPTILKLWFKGTTVDATTLTGSTKHRINIMKWTLVKSNSDYWTKYLYTLHPSWWNRSITRSCAMRALTCLAPRRTGCRRWLFSRPPSTVRLPGLGLTFSRFSIRFFAAPRSRESRFSWLWISAPESWTALPCVCETDDILTAADQLKSPCKWLKAFKHQLFVF